MKKMRQVMTVILAGGMLCASLAGCSRPSAVQQAAGATESETQTLPGKLDNDIPASQTDSGDVPATDGEYVYDYQVSMDPIPKEIADLGGPCQGTIHAFPSRIAMGLTQKMMEEDPELKAEVEKRTLEVEQALKDELGGEFRVDGVIVESPLFWHFFGAEVDTGYPVEIKYINWEWSDHVKNENNGMSNLLNIADCYLYKDTAEQEEQLLAIIDRNFEKCCSKVWVRKDICITVDIIQFTDAAVNRAQEQQKLLQLWEEFREYNPDIDYAISLMYFPSYYREIMEERYSNGNHYDEAGGLLQEYIGTNGELDKLLLQNGEVIAIFYYNEFGESDIGEVTLDQLLSAYQNGNYDESEIWEYWCTVD